MEDHYKKTVNRLYLSLSFLLLFLVIAFPVPTSATQSLIRSDFEGNAPFSAKKPEKSAQDPWVSQNIVNDSEFIAGGFTYSAWVPRVRQMGPFGAIEPTNDKVEYILSGGSYVLLQSHDDMEEDRNFDDLGESVGIVQTLPESLYFANPKNITFEVLLGYRFQVSGGSGSKKLATVASLQVGIDGIFHTLDNYEADGKTHSAYDSGIQKTQIQFNLDDAAYKNGYRTNFTLEIRILVEDVSFDQYISAQIDKVYVFCDSSAEFNADFYDIDNKVKRASILSDSKFTVGYWDTVYGWSAGVCEFGGTNNGVEQYRDSDFVFYNNEYVYSSDGQVEKKRSKTELRLADNDASGPDTNEMAFIVQTLPKFYFIDPTNISFDVQLKFDLETSKKSASELDDLSVGLQLGDQWVELFHRSSSDTKAYNSGEQTRRILIDMGDVALANSYSTAYPLKVILNGSTAGDEVAILSIKSVDVFCDFTATQAPITTHLLDQIVTQGDNYPLAWLISDPITNIRDYQIFVSDELKDEGSWVSGQILRFNFDTGTTGNYTVTLIATDGFGGKALDVVNVQVNEKIIIPDDDDDDDDVIDNTDNDENNADTDDDGGLVDSPADNTPQNSDTPIMLIAVFGFVAGLSSVMVFRRQSHMHGTDIKKRKVPYRPIQQHVLKLSQQQSSGKSNIQTQDDLKAILNSLKMSAQAAFAEGAYLEAIAQYSHLVEILAQLKMTQELHSTQIKLTFLQQAVKEKDALVERVELYSGVEPAQIKDFEEVEQNYHALLAACRKLNDLASAELYFDELNTLKIRMNRK